MWLYLKTHTNQRTLLYAWCLTVCALSMAWIVYSEQYATAMFATCMHACIRFRTCPHVMSVMSHQVALLRVTNDRVTGVSYGSI